LKKNTSDLRSNKGNKKNWRTGLAELKSKEQEKNRNIG
jgi:hypothetical protein